jgi:hypothetical protein
MSNKSSAHAAQAGCTEVSCSARIIRADGTVEDLGVLAYRSTNPLKQWRWEITQFFRNLWRKQA